MKRILRNIIWGTIGAMARLRLITPQGVAHLKSIEMLRRWMDFRHPKDLNEKINWLKFNTDTSLWTKYSDKLAVRDFVAGKGFAQNLVALYGHWDKASEIDWKTLPGSFVIKPNNGSGDILICSDKEALNIPATTARLEGYLKKRYGATSAEPHYSLIKPCLIAEQFLGTSSQPCQSSSLVDYKIWCFGGKPAYTMCCSNRTERTLELSVYDLDWQYHPEFIRTTPHYSRPECPLPRPECYDEMLRIASALSEGFPEVRIDLYEVDGKVYFGEMTFTSAGGFMNYYTQEFLDLLGGLTVLPERSVK